MSRQALASYGFRRVTRFFLHDGNVELEIEDETMAKIDRAVYAYLIGNEIVRIGSSKAPLRQRMLASRRHITSALHGLKSPTPEWEAQGWKERLERHGEGQIYARRGTEVTTPVGKFPAYLDEESLLIGRYMPPLNRSKNR